MTQCPKMPQGKPYMIIRWGRWSDEYGLSGNFRKIPPILFSASAANLVYEQPHMNC